MNRHINFYFLGVSVFLLVFGLLFLSTLSAIASLKAFNNTHYYIFHQLIGASIGLIFGFIAFKVPLVFLKKVSPLILFLNLLFLVAVIFPFIGTRYLGASRWINIFGVTLQPSEFFKLTIILYVSAWISGNFSDQTKKNWALSAKKEYDNFVWVFLPFSFFLFVIIGVFYFQKDISTLGIIIVTLLSIYFASKTPLWHLLLFIAGGIGGFFMLIRFEPYRMARFLTFLNPDNDPLGKGLQLKQSIIAIGSGGFFGKGLGLSTQKFGFLPESMSDSIFAIIGEETGILGCAVLILLLLWFLYLGFKIADNSNDKFSQLVAVGVTTWIVFQAFINIASSLGLFPLAGIPLPFFSYGSSHLIAEMIGVGLLLNISKNT